MLSRIADSLYWLSRYMERADGIIRMMRVNYISSFDKGEHGTTSWQPVLQIFSSPDAGMIEQLIVHTNAAIRYLLLVPENHNSVKVMVMRARENARGAQDHITKELWEQVNHLYHLINNTAITRKAADNDSMLSLLEDLSGQMVLYQGVVESSMPRNMGWSFMNTGKYLERALISLEVIDRHFCSVQYDLQTDRDVLFWRNLLLSLSGFELYLKNYSSSRHSLNVADQILFSREFNRSVRFCLDRMQYELIQLVEDNHPEEKDKLWKCFGRLYSQVAYSDMDNVCQVSLHDFLRNVQQELQQYCRMFTQVFFSYA